VITSSLTSADFVELRQDLLRRVRFSPIDGSLAALDGCTEVVVVAIVAIAAIGAQLGERHLVGDVVVTARNRAFPR
jgi:hypothetical protein